MVLCLHNFSPAKLGGFALRNIRTTSGMTAKCFMFLLAFAVSLLVWNIGAQAAGPSFVYDSLGRLVTVYDASGNAAVYKYDAVGNLLSITNSSSTTFVALELSSTSGLAGSTVTIYGTGFCSNPTVTFNGVAATVVSAAATQIVVTVPSNATTGSVVVTCGSNQSNAGTFTVASTAPSITGFTPTIGVGGTAVTISGANFQTTPANNAIRFAGLPSPATSSTCPTQYGGNWSYFGHDPIWTNHQQWLFFCAASRGIAI